MIWHRQDSVQALQEQERLAAQKNRLAAQSVEAARAFAAERPPDFLEVQDAAYTLFKM